MANKWQICIDVTEEEKDLLCEVLNWVAGSSAFPKGLDELKAQIELAWIEKEVEIIPPPSEWSATQPVAVDSDVLRRDAPYPTREMKRKWQRHCSQG